METPTAQVDGAPRPLVGLDLGELMALVRDAGEPPYRARQLYRGLYRDHAGRVSEISTLPLALRNGLLRDCGSGLPDVRQRHTSTDGTVRYLVGLEDGRTVECVFIPERARDTLCISSQAGCAVDCRFCLTALMGLERNLTAGEIVGQVLAIAGDRGLEPRRRPVNVVMMGMGEPLLNLGPVMKATRLLADPAAVGIPQRRITVSTSGIVPKIAEFGASAVRGKLAISLNASSQRQRAEIMPISSKYPLDALLDACRSYPLRRWERLTFEYVLLRDVNDSDTDARRVVGLLAGLKCKVNLIALNPGPGIEFATPYDSRVAAFRSIVHRRVPCFVRTPKGRDIFAACGQLRRTASPRPGQTDPSEDRNL
ncbi:MAG: 23S rRNA (adenine(2503)-C(2))-methyltransferase RlmN [Bryobacterales bacterium]|nr:23S rRNA (adenine(2503)-C(2))-methyltransferase RlmN [Bryobacterales bacterium]